MQGVEVGTIGNALWLEERRRGIGGSDVAGILGLSPWDSPYDVWLKKVGRAPRTPENEYMWWGTQMEALIARRYTDKTGIELWNPKRFLTHPDHPVLIGSPDRLAMGIPVGVEIKTASAFSASEWGAEGTDEIPVNYLLQCVHYLALTQFPRWDVAVLIGGNDFRIYTVRRDAKFEASLIEQLLEWWEYHVVGKVAPPITGHKGTTQNMDRMYRNGGHPPLLSANGVANEWADRLWRARLQRKAAEEAEAEAVNNLKDLIGDAQGMEGPDWRVTWKPTKGRTTTDYRAVVQHIADALGMDADTLAEYVKACTSTGEGSRQFRFTSDREGVHD
jgi:putative phage-type endonuclease